MDCLDGRSAWVEGESECRIENGGGSWAAYTIWRYSRCDGLVSTLALFVHLTLEFTDFFGSKWCVFAIRPIH